MPKSGPLCFTKNIAFFLTIFICFIGQVSASPSGWWNEQFHYRLSLTVDPAKVEEADSQVTTTINFSVVLKAAQARGSFAPNTLRVVEVNPAGTVIDDAIPMQFSQVPEYHAARFAQGAFTFLLKGITTSPRFFHLYFDTTEAMPFAGASQVGRTAGAQIANGKAPSAPDQTAITIGKLEKRPATLNTAPRNIVMRASERSIIPNVSINSGDPAWKSKPEHQFFAGYCTWYAARKWKEFSGAPVTWHGDGGRWFDTAAEEGRIVSDDPKAAVPGAVIVWTRRGRAGHVAFVEEVTDEGVRISEMNVKGRWLVSDAFLPFDNLDKGTKYKFKGYILPEKADAVKSETRAPF